MAIAENSNSFYVSVDGEDLWAWHIPISSEWIWSGPRSYYLKAGQHKLIIKQREKRTKLDKILFSSDLDYVPDSVVIDDKIAFYPFNGNAIDESANGNNGTVHGATLTEDRFGNSNSAYDFDGVDDYIKASTNGLPTASRTVSLWFYADSFATHPYLFAYGGGGCGTSWKMKHTKPSWKPGLQVDSHCDFDYLTYFYNEATIGAWYHWAITTDVNGTKMYINGVEKVSNNNFISNTVVNENTDRQTTCTHR